MQGVITMRHVLAHMPTVVRGFGWRVLFKAVKCALLGRRCTFLQIALM